MLRVNDTVMTAHEVFDPSTRPATRIPVGEHGTILDIDPDNGDLVVRFDGHYPGISHRGNVMLLPATEVGAIYRPRRKIGVSSAFARSVAFSLIIVGLTVFGDNYVINRHRKFDMVPIARADQAPANSVGACHDHRNPLSGFQRDALVVHPL